MTKKEFIKVILLTAICVAAFVGFFYIAMHCPLVGIYRMLFFALHPKIKNAYRKGKKKEDFSFHAKNAHPFMEKQLAQLGEQ